MGCKRSSPSSLWLSLNYIFPDLRSCKIYLLLTFLGWYLPLMYSLEIHPQSLSLRSTNHQRSSVIDGRSSRRWLWSRNTHSLEITQVRNTLPTIEILGLTTFSPYPVEAIEKSVQEVAKHDAGQCSPYND